MRRHQEINSKTYQEELADALLSDNADGVLDGSGAEGQVEDGLVASNDVGET